MFLNPKKINRILEDLDPDRIYVENIRYILGTNTRIAKFVCNIAVRKGFFEEYYGITCPNDNCGRIIKSYSHEEDIPEEISCFICQEDGEEINKFQTKELRITYYKYVSGSYKIA